ncbi:MAG: 30S ribosomal protein S17 [Nitrospirota bacterium]|jgi:small subunit ribosomal protein S17
MATKLHKRSLIGQVVSDKMEKTVVVQVKRVTTHPLYRRTIRTSKRYKAHDPGQQCHMGDTVRIVECRPISKDKTFRVAEVLERAV